METKQLESEKTINDIIACFGCPLSINHKEEKIKLGFGNLDCKTVIILASHSDNIQTKINEALNELCIHSLGVKLEEEYYITYLPKCYDRLLHEYKCANQAIEHCIKILYAELSHYCKYFTNIVVYDTKLSVIIQRNYPYIFANKNVTYLNTPYNTEIDKDEFKKFLINDQNLGI